MNKIRRYWPTVALLALVGFVGLAQEDVDLLDLTLEELQEVTVTAGTVVPTTQRLKPSVVTRFDTYDIYGSGARNLNELFDIFVPNLQLLRHEFEQSQLGTRGIFGAFGDKHLMLVNGRLMNHAGKFGALSERDLPLLGDIRSIDYVRGPGAVVYGPGALGGVIDINTHDGLSFRSTDLTLRQGFVEGFSALELRHGMSLGPRRGLFVYYGVADYQGADQDDAPLVYGRSAATRGDGPAIVGGEPVSFDIVNDGDAHRAHLEHKAHIHYTDGDFDAWLRYSRGGERFAPLALTVSQAPIGGSSAAGDLSDVEGNSAGYEQLTLASNYTHELSEDWELDLALSLDLFDYERIHQIPADTASSLSYHEEKWLARAMARWQPDSAHSLAFGAEYAHFYFGDGIGFPHLPASSNRQQPIDSFWRTQMWSLLAEHQWRINKHWSTHLGVRADRHSYTNWMYSPRAALIFAPTQRDTVKLLVNQSVRRSSDDDLRAQHVASGSKGEEEQLRSVELRYERQHSSALRAGISTFVQESELVDFNQGQLATGKLGDYATWGTELELSYSTRRTRLRASHGFTKLLRFSLDTPGTLQGFSSEPYGYGDDLASWSNHVSKLALAYEFSAQWTGSASLRVYWGFPGAQDQTEFSNDVLAASGSRAGFLGLSDPDYEKAYRSNVYLNLGLEYRPVDRLSARLDAFNVLGWFDKDLNKRNYLVRTSDYRSQAAALGITLRYSF
ncbi:MAG: outer membrane receptor protein involved in Fe transport [Rhodothermales bacterium]